MKHHTAATERCQPAHLPARGSAAAPPPLVPTITALTERAHQLADETAKLSAMLCGLADRAGGALPEVVGTVEGNSEVSGLSHSLDAALGRLHRNLTDVSNWAHRLETIIG